MTRNLTAQEYAWWERTGMLPEWARAAPRVDTRENRERQRPAGRDKRKNRKRIDTRPSRYRPKSPKIFLGIDGEGQTNPVTVSNSSRVSPNVTSCLPIHSAMT